MDKFILIFPLTVEVGLFDRCSLLLAVLVLLYLHAFTANVNK